MFDLDDWIIVDMMDKDQGRSKVVEMITKLL